CEIFVHPWDEPGEVWGKISFEWSSVNQTLLDEVKEADSASEYAEENLGEADAEVMMHASFHLHFIHFFLSADDVRDVAEEIEELAEAFFGDDGGVVAVVSMTSSDARLECLRFEVNTSAPLITDEPWWEQLAEVVRLMLDKLQEILMRLRSKYGSSRGASE